MNRSILDGSRRSVGFALSGFAVAVLFGGALPLALSQGTDEQPPIFVAQRGVTDEKPIEPVVTLAADNTEQAAKILESSKAVAAALGSDYTIVRAVPWTNMGSLEIIGVAFEVATPQPIALPAGTPVFAPQGEDVDASTWSVQSEPARMELPAASSFWVHVEFASGSVVSVVRSQPEGK